MKQTEREDSLKMETKIRRENNFWVEIGIGKEASVRIETDRNRGFL